MNNWDRKSKSFKEMFLWVNTVCLEKTEDGRYFIGRPDVTYTSVEWIEFSVLDLFDLGIKTENLEGIFTDGINRLSLVSIFLRAWDDRAITSDVGCLNNSLITLDHIVGTK